MKTRSDLEYAKSNLTWRESAARNIREELLLAVKTHGSLEAAAEKGRALEDALDEPILQEHDVSYRSARAHLKECEKDANRCRSLRGWGRPTERALEAKATLEAARKRFENAAAAAKAIVESRPALAPYRHLFNYTAHGFHSPVASARAHAQALRRLVDLPSALERAEAEAERAFEDVTAIEKDLVSVDVLDGIRLRLTKKARDLLAKLAADYRPKPKTVEKHRALYQELEGFRLINVHPYSVSVTGLGKETAALLGFSYDPEARGEFRVTKKNARAWSRADRLKIGRNILEVWKDPEGAEKDEDGLVEVGPGGRVSIKLCPRRSLLEKFLDVFRPDWTSEVELPPLPDALAEAG